MANPVQVELDSFSSALNSLETALTAERRALEAHDLAEIEQATLDKTVAIEILAEPRFGKPLADKIASLAGAERTECEQVHAQYLNFARELRDSNLVNGKILNRSQNSVREIINILSGKRADGLYGESGQPTADPNAGGPIARA